MNFQIVKQALESAANEMRNMSIDGWPNACDDAIACIEALEDVLNDLFPGGDQEVLNMLTDDEELKEKINNIMGWA